MTWRSKLMALMMMFAVPNSQQDLLALLAHINMHKKCSLSHSYGKTFLPVSLKMTEWAVFIDAKFPKLGSIKNFFTVGQKDVSQEMVKVCYWRYFKASLRKVCNALVR